MPHVSSRKLDKTLSKKLWHQLQKTFEDAGSKQATSHLISELLTQTERVMFAKRLAIMFLLDRGVPQHIIVKELSVSNSTVTRFSLKLEEGKFDRVLKIADKENILVALEKFLMSALPPRVGRGIWTYWGR